MDYKALVLVQVANNTFKDASAICPIHNIPYKVHGPYSFTCPSYDDIYIKDIGVSLADNLLIKIFAFHSSRKEIVQKIEATNIYSLEMEVNNIVRRELYFINSKHQKYNIYRIQPNNIDFDTGLPLIEFGVTTTYDTIVYPCIIDSVGGDISSNEALSVNFSFKPITGSNAKYKIFIMDRRKHQTKSATKTRTNNNDNNNN